MTTEVRRVRGRRMGLEDECVIYKSCFLPLGTLVGRSEWNTDGDFANTFNLMSSG